MKKIILGIAVLVLTGVVGYVSTTLIINKNNQLAVAVGNFYDPKPVPSYDRPPRKKDPCIEAKEQLEKAARKITQINENIRMMSDAVRITNKPIAYAELKKHQDSLEPALKEYAIAKDNVKQKCNENNPNKSNSTSTPATTTPTSTPPTSGPSSKPTNPPLKATPPKR